MEIHGKMEDEDTLAAPFEAHLRAMLRVHELTIQRRMAVAEERRLWAQLHPTCEAWSYLALSALGKHSKRLEEVGVVPHKEQTMTAETKARANVKRQETRKRLGIMGKKQRHFAKKKLRGG
jgi:hypothetical protein